MLYYVTLLLLYAALNWPPLAVVLVLLWVFRPWLPDPVDLWRTWRHMKALQVQIEANPANVPARRELGELWIRWRRPKRALVLLLEAQKRDPGNADLSYLIGLAMFRAGDAEEALTALVRAVDLEPHLRFGEPYLLAGEALMRLRRWPEAEDAFERFLALQSSSVKAYVLLGRVRLLQGKGDSAERMFAEARSTFWAVPWHAKRRQLWWGLRAWVKG